MIEIWRSQSASIEYRMSNDRANSSRPAHSFFNSLDPQPHATPQHLLHHRMHHHTASAFASQHAAAFNRVVRALHNCIDPRSRFNPLSLESHSRHRCHRSQIIATLTGLDCLSHHIIHINGSSRHASRLEKVEQRVAIAAARTRQLRCVKRN